VRELLALSKQRDVARVKRTAQEKLTDVERRIAELERVWRGLADLIAVCPGHGRAGDCPILKALGDEDLSS
jgi:MerR family transcriptional regulator, copper efflux regulator